MSVTACEIEIISVGIVLDPSTNHRLIQRADTNKRPWNLCLQECCRQRAWRRSRTIVLRLESSIAFWTRLAHLQSSVRAGACRLTISFRQGEDINRTVAARKGLAFVWSRLGVMAHVTTDSEPQCC